jgi:predicted PurR-regulated permease PerM
MIVIRAEAVDLAEQRGAPPPSARPWSRRGTSTAPLARVETTEPTPPLGRSPATLAIFALAILLVALTFAPLWEALLVAAVLAGTTHRPYRWLTRKLGDHPRVAATLMTLGVIVLVWVPLTVIGAVVVREGIEAAAYVRAALEEGGLEELVTRLPDRIESPLRRLAAKLPVDAATLSEQAAAGGWTVARFASDLLSSASRALFGLAMMLIAYFALLLDGPKLLRWLESVSPLDDERTHELFAEFGRVSRSVLGSALASALVQAIVAWIGFAIAQVPNSIFFAFLTGVAALVPVVGTPLITLPIAGLLLATGNTWQGIFLAIYAVAVISVVDNVVKPLVVRGGMQLNGALVFFSLIGGLIAFGGVGLIVGPLAVTFFLAMIRFTQAERASA